MDIVSHAIAGASAGAVFGRPFLGMFAGVIPDLVLPLKRVAAPTVEYTLTHSLAFTFCVGVAAWAVLGTWAVMLALISHLVLDVPTHGKVWSPKLLFPFSYWTFRFGSEWEWFNASWWKGATITLIWSTACILASQPSLIGFRL